MPSNSNHRDTRPNTAAPAGRTAAEDTLWATLHAHPATTTAGLAVLARIGRSTAGKILTAWATEGSVTRTPGSTTQGGRRGADTWTICDTTPQNGTEPTSDQRSDLVGTDEPVHDPDPDPTDETGDAVTRPTDHDRAEQSPGLATTPGTDAATSDNDGPDLAKAPRLGKGALRGMVEDYLTGRPGDQFSPSAIGTALGRSSGAVANALDKLVADGYAVQTQDKPKRYTTPATPHPATG